MFPIQKLILVQMVKKFYMFCSKCGLITAFIKAWHWSLSCTKWIQPNPPIRFNIILYLRLCVGSDTFLQVWRPKHRMYFGYLL